MIKYVTTEVVFREIPEETTLAINISNCPFHCKGCHSPELWEDIGKELTPSEFGDLLRQNEGITCVCFMGGSVKEIVTLLKKVSELEPIREKLQHLRVGWYTGDNNLCSQVSPMDYFLYFDYIKLGPYIKELGPINKETTNQRLYRIVGVDETVKLEDITYKFWKK